MAKSKKNLDYTKVAQNMRRCIQKHGEESGMGKHLKTSPARF